MSGFKINFAENEKQRNVRFLPRGREGRGFYAMHFLNKVVNLITQKPLPATSHSNTPLPKEEI